MPRFYVGHTVDEKEVWTASNVAAEGNLLVSVELSFAGQDAKPIERFKAALLALDKRDQAAAAFQILLAVLVRGGAQRRVSDAR